MPLGNAQLVKTFQGEAGKGSCLRPGLLSDEQEASFYFSLWEPVNTGWHCAALGSGVM